MKEGKMIDVSREIIENMVCWPGDTPPLLEAEMSIAKGDVCNLSSIKASLHTGTHIDAPRHFLNEGGDIASIPLSACTGTVKIFELQVSQCISYKDLCSLKIFQGDAVFFKTSNSYLSDDKFHENYVYLNASAAELLSEIGVRTVGIDYLSIDGYHTNGFPCHHLLLSRGIVIVEGLCLKDVNPGEYRFSCFPLKIKNADGSPVRAVLFT